MPRGAVEAARFIDSLEDRVGVPRQYLCHNRFNIYRMVDLAHP
jgi:hypothetical protein